MRYQIYQGLALVSSSLVHLTYGSIVTLGASTPYIASYLYHQGHHDVSTVSVSIIYPLAILFQAIGIIFSTLFVEKWLSQKMLCFVSLFCFALTVFITSFMTTLTGFIIFYGCFFGLFIGMPYFVPFRHSFAYFPDRKGLCAGICMMGYGLGPTIYDQIFFKLINPNDQQENQDHIFPQSVANNLPFTLRILALLYLILGMISVLLHFPKDSITQNNEQELKKSIIEDQQNKQEIKQSKTQQQQSPIQQQKKEQPPLKDSLLSKNYFLLLLYLSFSMPFSMFIVFNYKQYGQTLVNDDDLLSIAGSLGAVLNFIGRFSWNVVFDYRSFRFIMMLLNCGLLAVIFFLMFVKNDIIYVILVCFGYLFYGSPFGLFATQCVRVFGQSIGGKIYPFVFIGFPIGAFTQFLLHYWLIEQYKDAGYKYCFGVLFWIQLIAVLLSYFLEFQYVKQQKKLMIMTQNQPSKEKLVQDKQ